MLWKKLIERKVNTDSLWRGLAERREWIQFLFKPKPGESHRDHSFYRMLYPSIIKDIEVINVLWQLIYTVFIDGFGEVELFTFLW